MKNSMKIGFGFGLTSGVITTLGLIVGLGAGTHSKMVVISGILVIAIADALSDSLGIHIAKEVEDNTTSKNIWIATIFTFLSKFIFALTFIIPFLIFSLKDGVIVSIIWGFGLMMSFNYFLAKEKKVNPFKVIGEHLLIGVVVIILTYFIGILASTMV